MFRKRTSGVLLPVSALPSPYGIGDLGSEAMCFVDFLEQARQSFWQMLPLNMTAAAAGFSPYSSVSAFAGNPLFISPQGLYRDNWLDKIDTLPGTRNTADRVHYSQAQTTKVRLLQRAFARFQEKTPPPDYEAFLDEHRSWLDNVALFLTFKEKLGTRPWCQWPKPLRDRQAAALKEAGRELRTSLDFVRFCQYIFFKQVRDLRSYARAAGVQLLGDIPFYVAYDSADVWAHPRSFKLNTDKRPTFKAGVPPDYFSRTGQLWGNPVYDWARLSKDRYRWFVERLAHNLDLFDMVRIDHFRGLAAYWEVPGKHATAVRGQWVTGPGADLLRALYERCPFARIFAEDLGHITPDVRELMRQFEIPGMAVLQFGFGDDPATNGHCPHNLTAQTVVYTGTHDNNTTRAWFSRELTKPQQRDVSTYVGHKVTPTSAARDLIRLAFQSGARVAIVPMQDLLNLGSEARMNVPAKARGNWRWRMRAQAITAKLTDELAALTHRSGRA